MWMKKILFYSERFHFRPKVKSKSLRLYNASVVPSAPNKLRLNWLENKIIWEPLDGQHIIEACKQAKGKYDFAFMDDQEY